jgi:tRNA A37 threonylcarbamoyladenosine modification protein TsaB
MHIPLQTPLLLCLCIDLATSNCAAGQELERTAGTTRKQKESLMPLIDVLAERIELRMVEVEAKVVKRVCTTMRKSLLWA